MKEPFFLEKPQFQKTSNSWVEFYQHCEVDTEATKQAGYKVYRDVDFALMVSKGGKRKVPVKATEKHIASFPKAWEAYQNRLELQKTHLGILGLRPSQIKDLERQGIKCLEDLAVKIISNPYYEPYSKAAQTITQLRDQNDKESRSGERVHQEREDIPRIESKQHINNSEAETSQENQKESHQEKNQIQSLSYSFNI